MAVAGNMSKYDQHEACKAEVEYWRKRYEDAALPQIKQVVMEVVDPSDPFHVTSHRVLQILRVDAFQDGLRVLVR